MKSPEEYLEDAYKHVESFSKDEPAYWQPLFIKYIKQAQIDAYNEALNDVVKSARTEAGDKYVDDESILKLKKIVMSKLIFEHDEQEKSTISTFAYYTGRLIEKLVKEEINNLIERNKINEGKILDFYQKIEGPLKSEYAKYFGIKSYYKGKI